MNITRDKATLEVRIATIIGWNVSFSHACHSEGDAVAWLHLLRQQQECDTRNQQERLDTLRRRAERAERRAAAYKGLLRRQRRAAGPGTPSPTQRPSGR